MGVNTERFGNRLVRAVKAGGWLVPLCFIGGNPEQFVPARAVRRCDCGVLARAPQFLTRTNIFP